MIPNQKELLAKIQYLLDTWPSTYLCVGCKAEKPRVLRVDDERDAPPGSDPRQIVVVDVTDLSGWMYHGCGFKTEGWRCGTCRNDSTGDPRNKPADYSSTGNENAQQW